MNHRDQTALLFVSTVGLVPGKGDKEGCLGVCVAQHCQEAINKWLVLARRCYSFFKPCSRHNWIVSKGKQCSQCQPASRLPNTLG